MAVNMSAAAVAAAPTSSDSVSRRRGERPRPAGLDLELTESLIMEDVERNIGSLTAIRALGVSIAIDDFGTGYSSLAYLAKLPVDVLKIDRAFVAVPGTATLALVSTIVPGPRADAAVVAEGVETEEQAKLLRSCAATSCRATGAAGRCRWRSWPRCCRRFDSGARLVHTDRPATHTRTLP